MKKSHSPCLTERIAWRLCQLHRLFFCAHLYGITNAIKICIRVGKKYGLRTLVFNKSLRWSFRTGIDLGVLSHLWREGVYIEDTVEMPVLRIIDAGANIGDETLRFRLHYPNAQIVAVEPSALNYKLLFHNFSGDGLTTCLKAALWSSCTDLGLCANPNGNQESFHVTPHGELATEAIHALTIENIMERMNWTHIDILKLDIEGAEHELFMHNYECWIAKVNAFVFEVPDSDTPETTQLIFERLKGSSYNVSVCGECLVLIKNGLPWSAKRVLGIVPGVAAL